MVAPVRPRWERRKDARPSELTAAALALFVERGFAATRLEDIGARAGVSKGTLYLYFDGKEALFKAAVREGIVAVLAEGEQILDAHEGSSADLLRILMRGWWERIGATPLGGVPKLMIAECRNFPEIARFYFDEVITRGRTLIARALERGIAAGEFRAGPIPALVQIVFAPLLMRAVWQHSLEYCESTALNDDRYVETVIDVVLEGLAARSPEDAVPVP